MDKEGFAVPSMLPTKKAPVVESKASTSSDDDKKLAKTVFVSNLDFALKEDVYVICLVFFTSICYIFQARLPNFYDSAYFG